MDKPFFTISRVIGIIILTMVLLFISFLHAGVSEIYFMQGEKMISGKFTIGGWQYAGAFVWYFLIAILAVLLTVFYPSPAKSKFYLLLIFIACFFSFFSYAGIECASIGRRIVDTESSYSLVSLYRILSPFFLFLIVMLTAVFLKRRELFYYVLISFLIGLIGFFTFLKLPWLWCGKFMYHNIL